MIDPAFSRYVKQLDEFSEHIKLGHQMRDALRYTNRTRGLTESESDELRFIDRWLEDIRAGLS